MIQSHSRSHSGPNPIPRVQFDEVVHILLIEAMSAMEDSDLHTLTQVNQYNWLHLTHLVTYALCSSFCSLHQLFNLLLSHLKNYHYQRSKEEIMWIMLQFLSIEKSKSAKSQTDAKSYNLVLDIFNALYPDNLMNWSTCSTEGNFLLYFY